MTIKDRLVDFLRSRKKLINISVLGDQVNCPKGVLSQAINGVSALPNKHVLPLFESMVSIFYSKDFEAIFNDYVEHNNKISANIVFSYTEDNGRYCIYWLKVLKDFPADFRDELKFNLSRFGSKFTVEGIVYQSHLISVRASNKFSPDEVVFMVSEVYDSVLKSSIKSTQP